MTDTSRAARRARREQRRHVVRMGRREARRMILAGEFDSMSTRDSGVRRIAQVAR